MTKEHSVEVTRAKINSLFHNVRKLDGGVMLLSKKLRITPETMNSYLKQGKQYLENYKEYFSDDFFDIDTEFIEDDFELQRDNIKQEYMMREDISSLGDKYRNAFEVYFYGLREREREKYIYEQQKEIIENVKFENDENLNEKIKLLIQFKLVYDRAQMSIDEEKLYLKARYAKVSGKHLGTIIKDIERRNPEDFGTLEKKEKEKPTQIGSITNVFQLTQVLENAKQQIEQKEDFIDAEYEIRDGD